MKNSNSTTARALRERVKELTCLYGMSQLTEQFDKSTDEIIQGIVELIPSAWQYPRITTCRIMIDDHVYTTPHFKENTQQQNAEIYVNTVPRGRVEVFYTQKRPNLYEGPFLKEERYLLDAVAKQIGLILERREAEQEKIELQKQLMHAERLATIGQLAAGIAHELNEPLTNILGFAQLSLKCPGIPKQSIDDIEKIINAALYSREIIKKLLLFARQTPMMQLRVELNKVVMEGLFLLEHRCQKEGITLIRELSPGLPEITADPGQLTQVLVNLAVNAVQAMPQGGRLTVKTGKEERYVLLIVEDTGAGMTKDVLDKIFLPFFTTKDIKQGTGLGLSVVHGIIAAHRGTIHCDSIPAKGTRFTVRLPIKETQ